MQKETIIQGMLMCLSYLGHLCLDLLLTIHTIHSAQTWRELSGLFVPQGWVGMAVIGLRLSQRTREDVQMEMETRGNLATLGKMIATPATAQ